MSESTIKEIIKLVCHMIGCIYPCIGNSDSLVIDQIATREFDFLSEILGNNKIRFLSFEGERDGVKVSRFQEIDHQKRDSKYLISLDPVDGTNACAAGISRGITAIGLFEQREGEAYKSVPDCLSCFCIASNKEDIVYETLSDIKNGTDRLKRSINDSDIISSIHRDESELFWSKLGYEFCNAKQGENELFLPSLLVDNLFLAGDTSIPLFMESDYFVGRVGASESILESQLWKNWNGVLVSSRAMKAYPTGAFDYIKDRLHAAISGDKGKINTFFLDEEIIQLYNMGWNDSNIISFNTKEDYAPDFDLILIGSITGLLDKQLGFRSGVLQPSFFDGEKLYIEFWMKSPNYIGKINCKYDFYKREILWIKRN